MKTAGNGHANLPRAEAAAEPLDVLVIGTGFSGVCAGIKLLEQGINNFRIFEKSHGIGGTWYDNIYPGAACDVPSHFYCFSFEPNPNWTRVYSPQPEIQKYIEHCVDKYGLRPYIVHGARVVELRFDEDSAVWDVVVEDGRRVRARHVINGSGGLHRPSIPEFAGRDTFRGAAMHTARWDHSVELHGKRIAVVGSAASAIQVIPEIAKTAKQVIVCQRTPNYIAPRNDRAYTDTEKRRFARWPWLQRLYRWSIYKRMDMFLFPITKKDSRMGHRLGKRVKEHIRASVKDPDLSSHLMPDYAMGCKRILLSDDLFETFNRDNVHVETSGIERIEPDGVRTADGTLHEVDIIVYATGFDVPGHQLSIRMRGLNGASLEDEWADGAEAYMGSCIAGFPNYWMVTGPNTGVGTTSVVFMVEQMIDYILRMMRATPAGGYVTVKRAAQDRYNAELRTLLAESVWASGCKSWYITDGGKITTLYPKNAHSFKKQLAHAKLDDYEFVAPAIADKVA